MVVALVSQVFTALQTLPEESCSFTSSKNNNSFESTPWTVFPCVVNQDLQTPVFWGGFPEVAANPMLSEEGAKLPENDH